MGLPKISELLEQKKVEATKVMLEDAVIREDDEFVALVQEAQENNKDIMAVLIVVIMLAPVLSVALTLFNLKIDPDILRLMYTMLIGQAITNSAVAYLVHKQFKVALRRNTKSVYLHYSNKDSIEKLKEVQSELDKYREEIKTNKKPTD